MDFTKLKMAAEHTSISEERLALLTKEIFQEEFKKQKQNFLNIISGNFEITTNEIKNLKHEISELKSSLDFMEGVLEKKVEKLEENMKTLPQGYEITTSTRQTQIMYLTNLQN